MRTWVKYKGFVEAYEARITFTRLRGDVKERADMLLRRTAASFASVLCCYGPLGVTNALLLI
jgi:hypothetical protein